MEYGGGIQAVEVKAGMTVLPTAVRTLQKAIAEWKAKTVSPSIVYGGRKVNKIQDCRIIPWEKLGKKLFENIV